MNWFVSTYIICTAFSLSSCTQLHHHKQWSQCALVLRAERDGDSAMKSNEGAQGVLKSGTADWERVCVCRQRLPLAKKKKNSFVTIGCYFKAEMSKLMKLWIIKLTRYTREGLATVASQPKCTTWSLCLFPLRCCDRTARLIVCSVWTQLWPK